MPKFYQPNFYTTGGGRPVVWTPELDAKLIALSRELPSVNQIAKILGLSHNSIRRRARQLTIELPQHPMGRWRKINWTPELDARFIELSRELPSMNQIIKALGLHKTAIEERAHELGIDLPRGEGINWTPELDARLIELSRELPSVNQIMKTLGLSMDGIKYRARHLGIELPKGKSYPAIDWTPELDAQLIELSRRLPSTNQIVHAIGLSDETIHRRAKQLGIKLPVDERPSFMPFEEAREYVRNQGLLGWADWKRWSIAERPPGIPANPQRTFEDQWLGMTDWLEYPPTEESLVPLQMRRAIKRKMREKHPTIASILSYAQAKKTIQSVAEQEGWESFTDVYEWLRREDRPEYFPRNPPEFYEDWWKGWADFVGPELAPPAQTRDYLTLSGLAATHDQTFYHGSYDPLPVGTVMAGRGEEYEADWQHTDFYNILEHYRPSDKLPHKDAVFMVGDPDDIDLAGGATDYILTMEPLGSVTKHDLNWSSEISSLISEGYDPDSEEVELAATNYWEGVPHYNESVWEYLTPQARVTAVEAY